jgi:hypothetical protein
MQSQTRSLFFTIARELRDMVYDYYVSEKDGYHLTYETGKLNLASGSHINFDFAYTCKRMANEMNGLFLHLNSVNISTHYSNHNRAELGRSGILLRIFAELQVGLLAKARSLIDADTVQYVANAHPQFLPFINHVQTGFFFGASIDCGEVPSLHRKFVAETLQYMSRRSGFAKALAELVDDSWTAKDIHTVVSKLPLPWLLPHDRYLDDMDREMRSHRLPNRVCDREMYRLSVATVAITYLDSLSLKMRK